MYDRPSDAVHVERVWRSEGADARLMQSVTNSNWEMVISRAGGSVHVTVRGPETRVSMVDLPTHGSAVGIVFGHGTTMPHLPVPRLVDSAIAADHVTEHRMTLRGDSWEIPTFENAEDFVGQLVRSGVLRRDPLVYDVAAGADDHRLSARAVQLRVASATGLTKTAIRQIERARAAAMMLRKGCEIADVVSELGYYDQPHLSHALTRFIGRTATELRDPSPEIPLSLLYKTAGWATP
jgi:AraC-like DNA-binding protein